MKNYQKKLNEYEKACESGNITKVKKYINKVDITKDNYSGLYLAVINGHTNIVKLHVKIFPDLNINFNNCEFFVQALAKDHLGLAKYLLDIGGKKVIKIIKNGTALRNMVGGVNFLQKPAKKSLRWLINTYGPDGEDIISKDAYKETVIDCAENGHLNLIKLLHEKYEIDISDAKTLDSMIKWASRNYHYNILKYLVVNFGSKKGVWKNCYGTQYLAELIIDDDVQKKYIIKLFHYYLDNGIYTMNTLLKMVKEQYREQLLDELE